MRAGLTLMDDGRLGAVKRARAANYGLGKGIEKGANAFFLVGFSLRGGRRHVLLGRQPQHWLGSGTLQ